MGVRLAVITDTFPRWSERFILRELIELRRRGLDLTVFPFNSGEEPDEMDLEFCAWTGSVRCLPKGPSLQTVKHAPATLMQFPFSKAFTQLIKSYGARGLMHSTRARILSGWLKDGAFTHVYAHFANWPSTIAWVAAENLNLPFSFSVHARDLFVDPVLMDEKLKRATNIFVCHAAALKKLQTYPLANEKAILMHHGLPLNLLTPSSKRTRHSGAVHLVAAGRLVKKKGFNLLLDALKTKALDGLDLSLDIYGEGPEKSNLVAQLKALKLEGKVQLLAPVATTSLWQRLAQADVFAAPNVNSDDGDLDGIPNVVLEAMALGVPVVGTDAGSLSEVLTERTGWLASAGQGVALAAAINACLQNRTAAQEKAGHARVMIEKNYDIKQTIKPLARLYGVA